MAFPEGKMGRFKKGTEGSRRTENDAVVLD